MIVGGNIFLGDDDTAAAWKQHDVYNRALRVIVLACNRYARAAKIILDDNQNGQFGEIEGFDHRTMQWAHDLIAAAWRFEFCNPQLSLPFIYENEEISMEDRWLTWLSIEVDSWIHSPRLIRLVQLILCNQNEPEGYAAESLLGLAILDRFWKVPWDPKCRAAFETDFQTYQKYKKC
jgi:hypothetical protein